MPSAWVTRRNRGGRVSYVVRYRLGGRGTPQVHGGAFRTNKEATARRNWIGGELANLRVPDLRLLDAKPISPTLASVAERWMESRVDASENTRLQHRSAVRAMLPLIGTKRIDEITAPTRTT